MPTPQPRWPALALTLQTSVPALFRASARADRTALSGLAQKDYQASGVEVYLQA